jgi:aspartate/methionine/tyrosine aminotransferase
MLNKISPIILASKSPRRQELLQLMGLDFKVVLREVDETYPEGLTPTEIAVYIAEKKAKAFDEVIHEYVNRRNTLIKELQKIDGVKVAKPNGAFYCIVELPIKSADHFAQWLLETYSLNGETVMVAPAAGFYSTPGVGLNQIRIAYVLNENSLIKAVNILKEALKVYKD